MKLQNTHDVGIYCRLSRDDNNGSLESMSIANQKQLLIDYVKEKGWNLREIYVDDGFSGTNFDRPAFKRMLRDVTSGLINCIITKDLSRLGRNYSKVGYYTEEYFMEQGVRFIAINDSFDSMREEENEIAPFKNVLNEWYPRDISKKVRQVKKASARQGKFMGSHSPYGFRKSPEDKHVLIIDDVSADIVRRIFNEFVAGDSARMIGERLNQEGVDSPRHYSAKYNGGQKPLPTENNYWGSASILAMLKNQAYIGNLAQGKRQVVSFKSKKRRCIDPEDWIIVENTHEPIIDREVWDRVQTRIGNKAFYVKRRKSDHQLSLFSGILKCADCGAWLVYQTKSRKVGPPANVYRCKRYCNNGETACTQHYIQENTLKAFILNDIRLHAKLAVAERERITGQLVNTLNQSQNKATSSLETQMRESENRLKSVETTIKSLYEDKCLGKLPENIFQSLLTGYVKEQSELEERYQMIEQQLHKQKCSEAEIDRWLQLIGQYMEIEDLDRPTVMELIESITISEASKATGKRTQEITIKYRFIGNLLAETKKDIA
ncbi:MAG: recombinase family protein [Eubacteriales bacterium]|nr:recombinase family protein [Eubacteriales bacterium]